MVRVVESFFGVKGMMLRGFLSLYVRVLNRALRVWAEEVRRVEGVRRNGWRDRWLLTPFGWVRVKMPKFRRGVRTPCPLFERYSRFSRGFSVLVVLLYLSETIPLLSRFQMRQFGELPEVGRGGKILPEEGRDQVFL